MREKKDFDNLLKNKKILITGGLGFVGKNLIESLPSSCNIVVIDIKKPEPDFYFSNVEFIVSDITLEECFKDISDVDFIFHLSAKVGVDYVAKHREETTNTEILGMYNVCKFVESQIDIKKKPKIIYTSTSSVYGKISKVEESLETSELKPQEDYAKAKIVSELYLKEFSNKFNINYIIFRLFNTYGNYQKKEMVIPKFIDLAKKNKEIIVYDDGNQTRDFTYIEDVIDVLKEGVVSNCFDNQIFNIGLSKYIRLIDLAKEIKKVFNSESKIVFSPTPGIRKDFEVNMRIANNSKITKLIDIKFKNIKEGLNAMKNNFYEKKGCSNEKN